MSIPLTPKQKEVLNFLKEYYQANNFSPSMKEVANHFNVSISTVQGYFNELVAKGSIQKHRNQSRAIVFKEDMPRNMTISVPVIGVVSAGEGIRVYEESDPDFVEIPSSWINKSLLNSYFCLKVSGFSMYEDGILDGDIVLVKQQASASNGETVIAVRTDDGNERATIKVFFDRVSRIELKPRNENLQSIFINRADVFIKGKFCGLIRENCEVTD